MMRKLVLVTVLILGLALATVAFADPPFTDPTCDNPGGSASGNRCAGDNGQPGCQGIDKAEDNNPPKSDPAMDLATDILGREEIPVC